MRKLAMRASLLVLLTGTVYAIPITTLFNTGVDPFGSLLIGGNGTVDPHWSVTSGPGVGSPVTAVTYFEPVNYFADGPSSRWISLAADGAGVAGFYVFHTTFDLSGYNTALTSLTFNCAVDNRVTDVRINGVTVFGLGNSCDAYTNFGLPRTINSNFVASINSLDFTVENLDVGPVGFRAEFSSDTTASGVPEPGTLLTLAAGLAALQMYRMRARRSG